MNNLNPETPLKQCTKCHQWKSATKENYYWRKDRNYFSTICRDCENARLRQMRANDPEYRDKRNEIKKRWTESNPERYQARLDKDRQRYADDPEYREHRKAIARRTHAKKWQDPEWRELRKARGREYARNNHDKLYAKEARRRALKLEAPGSYTPEDIELQKQSQKNKCWFCASKFDNGNKKPEVDHLIPLTRGGTNYPNNIVISCRYCNRSRNNKLPHEWDGNRGRLI